MPLERLTKRLQRGKNPRRNQAQAILPGCIVKIIAVLRTFQINTKHPDSTGAGEVDHPRLGPDDVIKSLKTIKNQRRLH